MSGLQSPERRARTWPAARLGRILGTSALAGLVAAVAFAVPAEKLPGLRSIFKLQDQRADYVLVVDTSGSMRTFWPSVKVGLRTFIRSLPEGDSVSFVFFSGEASNSRILPRRIAAEERLQLEQEVGRLGDPDGLTTDLGRALDKTVAELSRPGANRLQFVFLLSDFKHEPPVGSPFPGRDPAAASWADLASRRRLAGTGRVSQTFALLLPLGRDVGRDLRLVEAVLGPTEAVSVTAATLEDWFERRREEIERDRLRILVREDLGRGWTAELSTGRESNRLTIRSSQEALSLTLAEPVWQSGELVAQGAVGESPLPRKGVLESFIVLTRRAPASFLDRVFTTRRTLEEKAAIHGILAAVAEPAAEIRLLGIDPESHRELVHDGDAAVVREGTPIWLQLLLLVLLALACWFSWRTWLRPRPLLAWHFRRISVSGPSGFEQITPTLGREPLLLVGNSPDATARVAVPLPAFCLAVESRRPRFPLLRPRRGVYVWKQAGPVKVEQRQFDPKRRQWAVLEVDLPAHPALAVRLTPQTKLRVRLADQQATIVFQR